MGSPPWDADRISDKGEKPHRRVIPHSFQLAAAPVTVKEWEEFRKDNRDVSAHVTRWAPEEDCPIVNVSMYQAMRYCNWLSRKEGIPEADWCYPAKIVEGMKIPADLLKRKGYRLPMEAEWEYAARAGTLSSRSYGEGDFLLGRHAWFRDNSDERSWPVGMKRPNPDGLADIHGNAWTWCHHSPPSSAVRQTTTIHLIEIEEKFMNALRGGSFHDISPSARSARSAAYRPGIRNLSHGLRPARTCD
jgi:formylglycine-generating enzyme required for sulfatase activity